MTDACLALMLALIRSCIQILRVHRDPDNLLYGAKLLEAALWLTLLQQSILLVEKGQAQLLIQYSNTASLATRHRRLTTGSHRSPWEWSIPQKNGTANGLAI